MLALTVAFFTAAFALVGKIISDRWERHRQLCGIATALADEIGAYMKQLDPPTTVASFRMIAAMDHETRRRRLRSMLKPPSGHPVFDKVADRIGLLPVTAAENVSSIYNVVTGLRIAVSSLSSSEVTEADDEVQIAILNRIADGLEQNHLPAQNLVRQLGEISQQSFLSSWM